MTLGKRGWMADLRDFETFQAALGLKEPWFVAGSRFDAAAKRLDIDIAFDKQALFACPSCGAVDCPVYDARALTWRHLNFWQHQTYLTARVPRVRCEACGVKTVSVPWSRAGSGFTLLFEAHVMDLIPAMPVAAAARMIGEHDTRLWRIIHHYVDAARARADHGGISRVAFDETAARRGHNYVSLFVDLDRTQVLFVADGKDAATVGASAAALQDHGGDPAGVTEACLDMSRAFIKRPAEPLPQAAITFDKFHAVKI